MSTFTKAQVIISGQCIIIHEMLKSGWYNIRVLKETNRQVLLDYNFYSEDHESANPIISFCMFNDFSKLVYVSMINDDSLSTIIFEQEPNKETRFYP